MGGGSQDVHLNAPPVPVPGRIAALTACWCDVVTAPWCRRGVRVGGAWRGLGLAGDRGRGHSRSQKAPNNFAIRLLSAKSTIMMTMREISMTPMGGMMRCTGAASGAVMVPR